MGLLKSWTETVREVRNLDEATFKVKVEDVGTVFVEAGSEGEVKQNMRKILKPDSFKTVAISKVSKSEMKKMYRSMSQGDDRKEVEENYGITEQEGVRKVDFVDGVTPDLQEAKPEFEVKYASSKKGPIKVTKFMSLKDAKKFLAQVKKEGMNGIISKGGKPVKEAHIECPKCKGEGCEHCDGKGYHMKEEVELEEHCGECEESIEEKKGSDYELYHKDFSSAMQHAYAHAKKKGFTVDPEEIDNKVATGPRKPSAGKTNRYILGTDKKQKVHIQVANLDNKKFELNMYIEETEKENMDIEETIKQVMEGKKKWQKTGLKNAEDDPVASKGDKWQKTGLKNEDSDKDEPGTQGDDKEYAKKRDAVLKKYGVKACAECETEEEKKACFKDLDDAHVADHEEQVQKESENEKKDTTYGVKKKAKEPQNETLLDKVRTMMKEKKKKSAY